VAAAKYGISLRIAQKQCFSIIGMVVVIGAIVGGYLMEKGNLMVLLQPAELLIIGGAALGTLLIANPLPVLNQDDQDDTRRLGRRQIWQGALHRHPQNVERSFFREDVKVASAVSSRMWKCRIRVESSRNTIFVMKDHHVLDFICDTLRMAMTARCRTSTSIR